MPAHYDNYDYESYWHGRDYEHSCEIIAIKSFIDRIPKIKTILDIGAGYGRIAPTYMYRAKKVILSDPSSKNLMKAKSLLKFKNIKYIHSTLENLPNKIKKSSIDVVVLVRVMHHLNDVNASLKTISSMIKQKGYLILEFPNKKHLKAVFFEFLRGNFTYPLDIFPKDIRCAKSIKNNSIPFNNYHPDMVRMLLEENNFKIIETRSVSNVRSRFFKNNSSTKSLISIEKSLQIPLARFNFGPSIFVLAQKL
jgi:2-polyprenyl-3-methyl-5-hydroxy-6-metoxy-1,4-benzoquinol methylase